MKMHNGDNGMIHLTPYNMPSIRDECCKYLENSISDPSTPERTNEYQDRIDAMRGAKLLWVTDDIKTIAWDAFQSHTAPDEEEAERAWLEFTDDGATSVFCLFENGYHRGFNVEQLYSGSTNGSEAISVPIAGSLLVMKKTTKSNGCQLYPLAHIGSRNVDLCRDRLREVGKLPKSIYRNALTGFLQKDSCNRSPVLPVTEKGAKYRFGFTQTVNPGTPKKLRKIIEKLTPGVSIFKKDAATPYLNMIYLCVYYASIPALAEIYTPSSEEIRRAPFKTRLLRKQPSLSEDVKIARLRPQPKLESNIDHETRREYTCRWVVRGHYTNQAYGAGKRLRRRQYIAPYVKGPEGLPLRMKTTVFKADQITDNQEVRREKH